MKALFYNSDIHFLKAFVAYLQKKVSDLSVDSFSVAEKAAECLESGKTFDLIIAPESFIKSAPKSAVCIATGSKTFIPEADDKIIFLNIYQKRDDIVSDLKRIISLKLGGSAGAALSSSDTKLISVLSPQGGSGKTTAAYLLAVEAAKSGIKTVFVSLEPFAALDKLCGECDVTGFSDIALRLGDDRDTCPIILEKMRRNKHDINMFPVPDNLADLLSVSGKEFARLTDALSRLPDVDLIVIDLGFPPSEQVAEILKKSHVIVLTVNDSGMGETKLEKLKNDPFLALDSMGAEVFTLWNKCRSERKPAANEVCFPFSEGIATGVSVVQVLNGSGVLRQGCRKIIKRAIK